MANPRLICYSRIMPSASRRRDETIHSGSNEPKSVLVVEDDPEQSQILREFLESHFYRVRTASNGVDALKAVMEQDYDVILCDLVMPTMAGDMFYHAVQRVKPRLCERFIFLTAHHESQRVRDFLGGLTEMVLSKPFHLDDLLETILLLFRQLESPLVRLRVPEDAGVLIRPQSPRWTSEMV
jgi:CheY-like chemotaxis protein